ncbi:hypothetical protein [Achromobacter insolitus]|uniref:hypothetical protein n=1 Tax=Achromobacter insolitus TaxID=217204 RepID=UPI002FE0C517
MALDLNAASHTFLRGISDAVANTAKKELATIKGFSESQLNSLAQQSALVAGMIEANMFTDAERDFYLEGLQAMAKGFVDTMAQLLDILIEELWDAVVGVIWKTIGQLARVALNVPVLAA